MSDIAEKATALAAYQEAAVAYAKAKADIDAAKQIAMDRIGELSEESDVALARVRAASEAMGGADPLSVLKGVKRPRVKVTDDDIAKVLSALADATLTEKGIVAATGLDKRVVVAVMGKARSRSEIRVVGKSGRENVYDLTPEATVASAEPVEAWPYADGDSGE